MLFLTSFATLDIWSHYSTNIAGLTQKVGKNDVRKKGELLQRRS